MSRSAQGSRTLQKQNVLVSTFMFLHVAELILLLISPQWNEKAPLVATGIMTRNPKEKKCVFLIKTNSTLT